jgi:hypothetical protein
MEKAAELINVRRVHLSLNCRKAGHDRKLEEGISQDQLVAKERNI